MQFNAKDDFVNEYQQELEQELLAEQKLETEQDHDFDRLDHKPTSDDEEQIEAEKNEMTFWEEQAFENERHGFISAIDDYEEEL